MPHSTSSQIQDNLIVSNWRRHISLAMKDTAYVGSSIVMRSAAAWDAGYISALLILGPSAAHQYAHPDAQVLEDVRVKLHWRKSRVEPALWFMKNREIMVTLRQKEQNRIRMNMLKFAIFMKLTSDRLCPEMGGLSHEALLDKIICSQENNAVCSDEFSEKFENAFGHTDALQLAAESKAKWESFLENFKPSI